jgi:hypothetical protein
VSCNSTISARIYNHVCVVGPYTMCCFGRTVLMLKYGKYNSFNITSIASIADPGILKGVCPTCEVAGNDC